MQRISTLILAMLFCLAPGWHGLYGQQTKVIRPVFTSSDTALNEAFLWARGKALSYAHGNDPVGPWYEAALPGREAFCMRDVSHQSLGAAILGLEDHTRNMFRKFAQNQREAMDYCSYWEINRYDRPAPVDYRNDRDFWYNLPANFDVLYNCYRQFLWTGDSTYLQDPDLLRFYEQSLREYVDRWELDHTRILQRDRRLHTDSSFYFGNKRGIPTYNEGGRGDTRLGIDMTASLIAAYQAYAQLLRLRGEPEKARECETKAGEEKAFLDTFWWDREKQTYRSIWYADEAFDYFMVGKDQAFLHYLLYFGVLDDPAKAAAIMAAYAQRHDSLIVELKSYLPILFYENGQSDLANELVKALCSPENKRRDYPENSFTVIEHLVRGLMGVEVDASRQEVRTLSRLNGTMDWAAVWPMLLGTMPGIRHDGNYKTMFFFGSNFNLHERYSWKACFSGRHPYIWLNGEQLEAEYDPQRQESYIRVPFHFGETYTASIRND
ncbi:MAG: hypothetical protein EP344_02760 [Bacteroidetes bacterium]|nr:MAG: hypothetical protein EP344_02760 [Bacteroidota bacterium]